MDTQEVEQLRLERLRRRVTQFEIYAATGIRPERLSRFENNLIEPRPDELTAWKSALGMGGEGEHGEHTAD